MSTKTLTLADEQLKLEFSAESGALVGMTALATGWKILDRPHLGLSFRLFVPRGRRRNNPVDGEKQRLTSVTQSADGRGYTFVWDGVESPHAGHLDIRVEITVRLEGGKAVWSCTLLNRSNLVIEAAYVPYLGDLKPAAGATGLWLTGTSYVEPWSTQLRPKFHNHRGYFGVDHPVAMHGSHYNNMPMNPFFAVTDDRQGLYIGVEGRAWEYVVPQAEARPGYSRSIDATLPTADHISRHEVSTRLGLIHFPYVQPGETRALQPIGLAYFKGSWTAAADIYRRSSVQPKTAATPAWMREPHSWLQIQVNSPEGEARTRYKDLVPLAAEMARHGITGMQITGWNFGGQDQDNPTHDTDPLLGTWEEFRDAIRQIQALGVKVILFAKFTWADQATEWFRRHLKRLAVTDPWGDYYLYRGYSYHTPMQLQDISTKRLIPMCMLSEEYLKICEAEFRKILDLGADGFLYDECQHHGTGVLCFHPDHGHRPGALAYGNDLHLVDRFRAMAEKVRPDFCFAGEGLWDWQFSKYHLSYFRTERTNHVPWFRYVRPEAAYMTAVTGFDDREMLAQCLMYRYVISYEAFNFKGRPEDFPLTLAYGKQMDALRTELRRWFWDGEFRYTRDATVTGAGGKPHHPYGVFRPQDGGAPGIAIANYDTDRPVTVTVAVPGHQIGAYRYRLIDDQTWMPAANGVVIPARGCAVVVPRE